ncbi:hypothetical protein Pmar_PMAR021801 [Perkinsus marinus ATCC 50983]|uniref:Uncharacterized protein n=1 Tax=Perkinsus marinus (strain ATCC 50983 / TXsc) TaxID=423536 RepID=C5LG41_PERM5|nr:hypothetical protein Pmar_PMAR021801 [Perkinsus marinus ATCC 50983]EER04296.1 hypothetical protein Pmar_PMAR021801 [Perkinsus marinus ATCC 50983]|eukprot:XP_002772480.1 hypothetical protein Pmar_PMAR021801 [Perkinsus marinus ATCC 50983]
MTKPSTGKSASGKPPLEVPSLHKPAEPSTVDEFAKAVETAESNKSPEDGGTGDKSQERNSSSVMGECGGDEDVDAKTQTKKGKKSRLMAAVEKANRRAGVVSVEVPPTNEASDVGETAAAIEEIQPPKSNLEPETDGDSSGTADMAKKFKSFINMIIDESSNRKSHGSSAENGAVKISKALRDAGIGNAYDTALFSQKALEWCIEDQSYLLSGPIESFVDDDDVGGPLTLSKLTRQLLAWATIGSIVGVKWGLLFSHFNHVLRAVEFKNPPNIQSGGH